MRLRLGRMEWIVLVGLARFELATPRPPDRVSIVLAPEPLITGVHG